MLKLKLKLKFRPKNPQSLVFVCTCYTCTTYTVQCTVYVYSAYGAGKGNLFLNDLEVESPELPSLGSQARKLKNCPPFLHNVGLPLHPIPIPIPTPIPKYRIRDAE